VDLGRAAFAARPGDKEPIELWGPEAGPRSGAGGEPREAVVRARRGGIEDIHVAFATDHVYPVTASVVEQVLGIADARDRGLSGVRPGMGPEISRGYAIHRLVLALGWHDCDRRQVATNGRLIIYGCVEELHRVAVKPRARAGQRSAA